MARYMSVIPGEESPQEPWYKAALEMVIVPLRGCMGHPWELRGKLEGWDVEEFQMWDLLCLGSLDSSANGLGFLEGRWIWVLAGPFITQKPLEKLLYSCRVHFLSARNGCRHAKLIGLFFHLLLEGLR